MNPPRATMAPRNTPTPQNSTPNHITQRTTHNSPTRRSQLMWAFITRNPTNRTLAHEEAPPWNKPGQSQATNVEIDITNMPHEQHPETLPPPTTSLQRTLHGDVSNTPWGDYTQYNRPHEGFRILSKNVSTLNSQNLDMLVIATELQQCDASVFLAQETNTPWTPQNLQTTRSQCQQVHCHLKMATSSSTDSAKGH